MRSVLEQGYTPLEYIVVDGASTDGSQAVISRYAHRLAWWVSEPDRGQAEAINKGFQRARGEVVAWLNSDDLYLAGAVAKAVWHLKDNPSLGLVFSDAVTMDGQGRPLKRLSFGDWGLSELMGFRIICQPGVFMRRSVLEKAGYLDDSYHLMLDHHLWIRIAQLAPVKYAGDGTVASLWAAARHHPAAKNVAQADRFREEIFRILEWMETQPDLTELHDRDRRRILGGAHRLAARYLLDSGLAREALSEYMEAFRAAPRYALKHWHRMLYAAACLTYFRTPVERLQAWKSGNSSQQLGKRMKIELGTWVGLHL